MSALFTAKSFACQLNSNPITLIDDRQKFLQVQIEMNVKCLWKEAIEFPYSLSEFRNNISSQFIIENNVLLTNQSQRFHENDPNRINIDLVLNNSAGLVRKINKLESILLARQTDRSIGHGHTMYTNPTEFLSYVLHKEDKLKIYYYTTDQAGIRGIGTISNYLMKDFNNGWELLFNLHNHNFFPNDEYTMGGVVPSSVDIQLYRMHSETFGLNLALITNGFDTIEINKEDFNKFNSN